LLNIVEIIEAYKICELTFSGKCYGGGHSAETYILRSCAFRFATCVMCSFGNAYRNSPEVMMEDFPFHFLCILILMHLFGVS
jgi:hypothetical protein